MIGRVIKGIGGFYFVHDGHDTVMGKARGNLKRNKDLIYVGDIVDFDIDDNDGDNECVINKVVERKNFLTRPPVSNLDMLVVVFSIIEPAVNYPVIDKLLAGCERIGIRPVVCISKKDLVSEDELKSVMDIYSGLYPVVSVNGNTGEGMHELMDIIRGHSAALAGPSGVGKSTITNHLAHEGEENVQTGSISEKTGRGRHTTRHVEIFALPDSTYLYDTPGFTSLDMPEMDLAEVRTLFPEFRALAGECRYNNCAHINEPDCAVKDAVREGSIGKTRYGSYLMMMEEVKKWLK
ncbi:MAG: ribosome small subunit-dependent GTPase A [Mogibacterium sp.]|nr:ribosome small subunit-dependent GTPase A [Mogibacterium sp.]MBR2540087.1 ribosome small subunit-dependent GTPase A [Mogibacterium sp.]